jgi:RNA polymerase sigma-70 factor (ECF subfamily)
MDAQVTAEKQPYPAEGQGRIEHRAAEDRAAEDRADLEDYVRRAQDGSRDAFDWLVAQYRNHLRVYIKDRVGDPHKADDIFQEVWLKAIMNRRSVEKPGSFKAWIETIARGCIADLYRKQGRTRRHMKAYRARCFPGSDGPDLLEYLQTDDERERVRQTIKRLSPDHQDILGLKHMLEMKYEDIAQLLECPVGTVKSRLYYAEAAFVDQLNRIRLPAEDAPATGLLDRLTDCELRGRVSRAEAELCVLWTMVYFQGP